MTGELDCQRRRPGAGANAGVADTRAGQLVDECPSQREVAGSVVSGHRMPRAASIGSIFKQVSAYSASGSESATIPAPA